MQFQRFLAIMLFTAIWSFSTAQTSINLATTFDTISLSIEEAIRLTISNNPDLKRIQMNELILESQIKQAKGSGLPQLTGKVGYTNNFSLAQQLLPGEIFGQSGQIPVQFGVQHNLNTGIEINQKLFDKGYLENVKKLDATRETYKLQSFASIEDLVYKVAQIYIQYQITDKQKEILNANFDRTEQLIKIALAQLDNGIIKKLDVDQIKVNRTNLVSELANIEMATDQQLNQLRYFMALDMNQPLVLNEKLDNLQRYPISDQLLLSENINYQLLQKQQEITARNQQVIKAGYYPTLSAFFQYNYTGQSDKISFNSDVYSDFTAGLWGLNMSIPLFDGLQKKNQLQINKLEQQQLDFNLQILAASTQMEFKNAQNKIKVNDKLIFTQQENMQLAQQVYDITKLSYQEGVSPLTELLNAETGLKEAQSQYLSALLNFKLAELDHIKFSGVLAKRILSNQ
jgi:outer membrane protein TolC